jgi:hypothetical protein
MYVWFGPTLDIWVTSLCFAPIIGAQVFHTNSPVLPHG